MVWSSRQTNPYKYSRALARSGVTSCITVDMKTVQWTIVGILGVASILFCLWLTNTPSGTTVKEHEPTSALYWSDFPRSAEYCNPPLFISNGEEGFVAEGYQLEGAQVVLRHGDRSSMTELKNLPRTILSCSITDTFSSKDPLYRKYEKAMRALDAGTMGKDFESFSPYPHKTKCQLAELTAVGAHQALAVGAILQQAYLDRWSLFDRTNYSQYEFWSTERTRTYQTAVALIYGLLSSLDHVTIHGTNQVTFCSPEIIGFDCNCPASSSILKQGRREVHNENQQDTSFHQFQKDVKTVFQTDIFSLMDSVMPMVCHGIPLPCQQASNCINRTFISMLWHRLDQKGAREVANEKIQASHRLTLYPFMFRIYKQFFHFISGRTGVRFTLYSGHDTTINPLAKALGFASEKWPPYVARIIFELYSQQRASTSKRYSLRVLYNGKDVTAKVTFCKGNLVDGLCPFDLFLKFLNHECLQGKSYAEACGQNL